MDSKQFDELVARLASASSRRSAVKGVIGGALASAGVISVASAKKDKSKKGKKKGKGQSKGSDDSNGHGYGLERVPICHKGRTIEVAEPAVSAHLEHGDTLGPCD